MSSYKNTTAPEVEPNPNSNLIPAHQSFFILEINRESSDKENSTVSFEDQERETINQRLNVSLQPITHFQMEPINNLCSITDSLLLHEKSKHNNSEQTQMDNNHIVIEQSEVDNEPKNHRDSNILELELIEEDPLSSVSDVRSIWLETINKESKSSMNSGEIKDNSRSNTVHSFVINQKNSFSSQNFPIISNPNQNKTKKRNLCQLTLTNIQVPLKQDFSNRNHTDKFQPSDTFSHCDQNLMIEPSGCESPFDELLVSDDSKTTENILHKKVMFKNGKGHHFNQQIKDLKPKVKCSETIFSKMKSKFQTSDELNDPQIFEVNDFEFFDGDVNQNLLSYVSEIHYHLNHSGKSDYTFRDYDEKKEIELTASNNSYLNESNSNKKEEEEETIIGILESVSFRPILKQLSPNIQPVLISKNDMVMISESQLKIISPLHEPFKLKPENLDRNYV